METDSEAPKDQKLSEMSREKKAQFLFQLIHLMLNEKLEDRLLIATTGITPLVLHKVKGLLKEIEDLLVEGVDLDNPRFKLVLELGELVKEAPREPGDAIRRILQDKD